MAENRQLDPEVKESRRAEYGVDALFLNRWSPRAFTDQKISDDDLYKILEAGHWAASSYNDQPWRFVVAKTEEQLKVFHQFLSPFNLSWAEKVPVLIMLASDTKRENGDANGAHAFDTGTAWGYLSLQAGMLGISTHAIGGFDREAARKALNVPEHIELHAVIALGYRGEKESLSEALQAREMPSGRKPLSEVVLEGTF
ncbi:nitroreductase family protein [Peribacillus sp. SCS-37]|uniref:nitroreductase family protein n=1 Tax=Paraperibacillus esterisolvens TaxID=3115296 RepID=UPI00390630C7